MPEFRHCFYLTMFFSSKPYFYFFNAFVMRVCFFLFFLFFPFDFFSQVKIQTGAMGAEGQYYNSGIYAATGFPDCNPAATQECDINSSVSDLVMSTESNKEFVFDSFAKYAGGITFNGSTILKVKVGDNTSLSGTCKWKLQMIVSNGTSPDDTEWETLTSYGSGSSGTKPTLDILQVRVDNGCHTPFNAGLYVTPFTTSLSPGNAANIINTTGTLVVNPAPGAPCSGGMTNGVGTYLGLDYNEFSFTIDYRIKPGFDYLPGRYEIGIKFCLTED